MRDTADAFIDVFTLDGAGDGPLRGLTFGAKDLFDVAGHITGCGSPDKAAAARPAAATAPAVTALLAAGGRLVGKTHTDEIAYSLMGVNAHYGTPLNSAAPDRVPGGSSSGSVAAAAAGLVDFALGSDTGGSVRLPASFCGVLGIRTSHGAIDLDLAMPLAPSFDTAGWFARDGAIFARVGAAYGMVARYRRVRVCCGPAMRSRAPARAPARFGGLVAAAQARFGAAHDITLSTDLSAWRECFRIHQAGEIWRVHGDWVTAANPAFGPGVKERFAMAAGITDAAFAAAAASRFEITTHLVDVLGDDGFLLLPTSPGPAPLKSAGEAELDAFRTAALELLCPAGLAGLPQVSLPAGTVDGAPVGLSLIGPPGGDGALLAMAEALTGA